jgi:hypothetical protein
MRELIGSLSAPLTKSRSQWPKPELHTGESDSAAMMHPEPAEQLGNMDFHGTRAEAKFESDLLVGLSDYDQIKNIALAFSENASFDRCYWRLPVAHNVIHAYTSMFCLWMRVPHRSPYSLDLNRKLKMIGFR